MNNRITRLTDREVEIAQWILLGYTSKEVSRILITSERTVDTHVNNVRFKTGAKNRIHMATHLLLRDLVTLDEEDLNDMSEPREW